MPTNKIKYNGKTLMWEYKISACVDCPIYPTIIDDEEEILPSKCDLAECVYNKRLAKEIAIDFNFMKTHYYCENCDEYFDKNELTDKYCPICGQDLEF